MVVHYRDFAISVMHGCSSQTSTKFISNIPTIAASLNSQGHPRHRHTATHRVTHDAAINLQLFKYL